MATGVDELLDLATAGRHLGIDRRLMNDLVLERRLPAHRLGQRWFVSRAELEEFARTYTKPTLAPGWPGPEGTRPVLEALDAHPGATVRDLAERLGRPRRTILGWVQMLDQEGLVERHRGRSQSPDRCFLTDKGRTFCKGGRPSRATA